jgi:hypothetical protein
MERTVAVINDMVADGVIENYAVAGAIGAMFYGLTTSSSVTVLRRNLLGVKNELSNEENEERLCGW